MPQPKNTNGKSKSLVVNLPKVDPKRGSIRFDCADSEVASAPITAVYIKKAALAAAGVTEQQITGAIVTFCFTTGDK